jgi:predicted MFS family arabinose efflux permease
LSVSLPQRGNGVTPNRSKQVIEVTSARWLIIGCISVYAVGTLPGWLAPPIMFGAIQKFGVSAAQAGTLTLVEGVTGGILSIALGALQAPVTHRRLAVLGFGLFVATNGMTPWMAGFLPLLGLRFVAGIADAILMFVGVSLVATRYANPDRGYAILTVSGSICGALNLELLPLLRPNANGLVCLPFAAIFALLVAALTLFIPADYRPGRSPVATPLPELSTRTSINTILFAVLFATMVPLCSQAFMMVAFSPELGQGLGISQAAINMTLGGATLAAIAGPFLGAWAVSQFARWRPFFAMAVVSFGVNLALTRTGNQSVFVIGLLVSEMAAYFFMPILLGWAAQLDPSGRYSSLMIGGVVVTTSITPTVVGMFVDQRGLAALSPIVITTGLTFVSLLLLLCVLQGANRRTSPA